MAVDLGTAFGRIVIDGRGANAGLGVAQRGLLSFGKAAGLVFAGVAAAAGVGIGMAVRTAATFEQAMADLSAVSGATGATLEQLSEQALESGASTRYSASEAAAAQLELAKAGVELDQILSGGLEGSLALAAAGNLELADAASIAANAMNLFGIEGAQLGRVADALATAANVTTADVGDFGMALTQGGAAAKAAGLDFNDTVAILEALALAGVKNSDAGTSMKAALLQLINPTDKQAQLAKELGLNLFTANGELKDGAGIAAELRRATEGMTKSERARTLAVLAGTDGMRALLALYDAGPRRLAALERAQQRQGTAAEVAARRQDSLLGALEELGGAVETLQIRFGRTLTPLIRDAGEGLTNLVNAATDSGQLERFGEGLAEGVREGAGATRDLVVAVSPLAHGLLGILADGFTIVQAAATGAAPVVMTVANAAGVATGAVLALVSPVVELAAAVASLPGVMQLAAAALVGLGAAIAVVRLTALLAPAAQLIGLFVGLASSAGTAAAATTALGLAQARLAGVMTFLTSPVGIAAAAIGLATAGVVALASGMFRGASPAEQLSAAMDRVRDAANGAAGAVNAMRDATDKLGDAQLNAKDAALRVQEAEVELARLRATGTATPLQLQRAELNLERARRDAARATRDASAAQTSAAATARNGVASLIELATAQGSASEKAEEAERVARRLGPALGIGTEEADRLAGELGRLTAGGASTERRLDALQDAARRAARGIEGTGPAARKARQQLEAIADATPGQLEQFVADITAGTRKGQSRAEATRDAINRLLASTGQGVTVDLSSLAASIRSSGQSAIAAASAVAAAVRRELSKANADQRSSPSANDLVRASLGRTAAITRRGLAKVLAETRGGVDAVLETERGLSAGLEAIDRRNERRERAAERRRLVAATRRGDSEERARAAADLRRFDAEQRRDRQRAVVELAQNAVSEVQSAMGGLEGAMAAIGQAAATAIDRSLQAGLSRVEEGLRQALADVANSPEAARIAAIGSEVDALRQARAVRDAGRRRAELGGAATEAGELVERRRAALARARTASERQAAQQLLDQALAAQSEAAAELADFEEDQRIAALEAERAHLEAILQARRDAATTAAQAERDRLQAEADAQRAALDKQLGDLQENLRARPREWRKYVRELQGILGDPKLAAQLADSGRELGLAFSRGMSRAVGDAEDAAQGMARAIARYLKLRSPAEAGPLRYDFAQAGRTIGADLAAGMASRRRLVALEASRLASAATLAGARAPGPDRGAGSGGDQFHTYNVAIPAERPVEEPLATAHRLGWELVHGGRRRG